MSAPQGGQSGGYGQQPNYGAQPSGYNQWQNFAPGTQGGNLPAQTQYPIQSTGPAAPGMNAPGMHNIMSFDDTARYQQGGQYGGTGASYDPTYRPNGDMRQSFADPSGYAAMRAQQQGNIASQVDARHQRYNAAQGPGFGPPPPATGDPYNMGGLTPGMQGDPYGLLGRMPTLPTRRGY